MGTNQNGEMSQTDRVYNFIIEQLRSGAWKPGDRIFTEQEFCDNLGVSRVVVREAVEKRVALGFLDRRRKAGTFVKAIDIRTVVDNVIPLITISSPDIMDVLHFRLYFEPENIRAFMEHMEYSGEKDLALLEETYEEMKNAGEDHVKFYTADYRFHDLIAKGTGNPITIAVNDMLTGIMLNTQLKLNRSIGDTVGLKYHGMILDAIRSGDRQMAELLMRRHIEAAIREMEESVKRRGPED